MKVRVDTPRGGFVKRHDDGSVDFVSPVPSPFNYGSVPDTSSTDGDRLDALVLGERVARGRTLELPVVGRVDFVDAGLDDPKLVLADHPPSPLERASVEAFFRVYALAKRALHRLRGARGATHLRAVRWGEGT